MNTIRRALLSIAAAMLGLAGSGTAPGQTAPLKAEDVIPGDSYVFATFSGVDAAAKAAEELGLYKLWSEPSMQAVAARLLAGMGEPSGPDDAGSSLFAAMRGRIAIAVTGVNLGRSATGLPQVLLVLDAPGGHEELDSAIGQLFGAMTGAGEPREAAFRGVPIRSYAMSGPGPAIAISTASIENLFLVGLGEAAIRKAVNLRLAEAPGSIAKNEALTRCRARGRAAPTVEFFLALERVVPLIRLATAFPIPPQAERIVEGLERSGLLQARAIHYMSAIEDSDTFATISIDAPAPRAGILDLAGGRAVSRETLALVPSTAIAFAAMRLDPGAAIESLAKLVPGRGGTAAAPGDFIARFAGRRAADRIATLLPSLGSEVLLMVDLPEGLALPRVTASVEIRDGGAILQQIDELLASLRLKRSALGSGTREFHLIQSATPARGPLPFSPCFLLRDDRLVLSLSIAGLREAAARIESQAEGCPAGAFLHMDTEGAAGLHYVDIPRMAGILWEGLAEFLPQTAPYLPEFLPLDLHELPSADVVKRHLKPFAGVWNGDAHGVYVRSRTIGLASLLALGSKASSGAGLLFELMGDSGADPAPPAPEKAAPGSR